MPWALVNLGADDVPTDQDAPQDVMERMLKAKDLEIFNCHRAYNRALVAFMDSERRLAAEGRAVAVVPAMPVPLVAELMRSSSLPSVHSASASASLKCGHTWLYVGQLLPGCGSGHRGAVLAHSPGAPGELPGLETLRVADPKWFARAIDLQCFDPDVAPINLKKVVPSLQPLAVATGHAHPSLYIRPSAEHPRCCRRRCHRRAVRGGALGVRFRSAPSSSSSSRRRSARAAPPAALPWTLRCHTCTFSRAGRGDAR